MYGAIIGDLAGSIYEFNQVSGVHSIKVNKIIDDNFFYINLYLNYDCKYNFFSYNLNIRIIEVNHILLYN